MQRFRNILCVVDTELEHNAALEHAVKLAENDQASLSVVEVIDEIPPNTKLLERTLSPVDIQAQIVEKHQDKLEAMLKTLSKKLKIKSRVLAGVPFLEVIHEVISNDHDLVFKTAGSSGLLHRVFGSNDMHLLRKCPCPVWLVKSSSPSTYKTIVAAVDVDDCYPQEELNTRYLLNLQVLEMASSLALSEHSDLHIVHAWDAIAENLLNLVFNNTPEKEITSYVNEVRQQCAYNLDKLMHVLTDKLGQDALSYIKIQRHLIKGYPRHEIPAFTKKIKADLVVMGTIARTGIPGLFIGNTAENIINQLDCSILAVKPPGFVSPVTLMNE